MALTPDFTASESLGFPSQITLTDDSAGSDGSITTRRVYVQMAGGTYLTTSGNTQNYETWPIVNISQSFDLLPRSVAVNITVQWLAGSTVVYTLTKLYCFDLFDYIFSYTLTQQQTADPDIVNDVNYWGNKSIFMVNLKDAAAAVAYGGDIYSAQNSLNRNFNMIKNQDIYF